MTLGQQDQKQSGQANKPNNEPLQYSSSDEGDVDDMTPVKEKCRQNGRNYSDNSPITPVSRLRVSANQNPFNRNSFEADEKTFEAANKGVKFSAHQLMHLINQCMESFRIMKSAQPNQASRQQGEMTKEQQFYSNIILLRIIGRKCELTLNDQALTFIDNKLKKLSIHSEYARSGISSRAFKSLMGEEGNRCFNKKYATLSQLHGPDIREKYRFTSNYSFQRTAKYILALKRYEEEVVQSRVTNSIRAQEIGLKLNRIAGYAQENQLWIMESMCRKRGLKIVHDLWNMMPIKFDSENLMVNTDSRTVKLPSARNCNFIRRAAGIFTESYIAQNYRTVETENHGQSYLDEYEDEDEYEDCYGEQEFNSLEN